MLDVLYAQIMAEAPPSGYDTRRKTRGRGKVAMGNAGIWSKSFISLFIVNGIMWLVIQMVNVLVSLDADALGATSAEVGFVMSSFAITALVFKVFSAPAIDAFSRRALLAGSLVLLAAAFFIVGVTASVPMLVLARLLQGVSMAFSTTTCLAMATDSLPPERMGSGIGFFSVAQAAFSAVGPLVGLALAEALGYDATFLIAAGLMFASSFAAFLVKEPQRERRPFKLSPSNVFAKSTFLPAFLAMLLAVGFGNVMSFMALYGVECGIGNDIGLFFTVNALLMLLSRPLMGSLADRFGLVKVLIPSLICYAVTFLVVGSATTLPVLLFAAVLLAFGYGAAGPMIQTFCMKCVPPDRRGVGSSAYYIGVDVGNLIGPVIAGGIVGEVGYAPMWNLMIVPIAIAFALVLVFRGRIGAVERAALEKK